jgi:hypothetical protein
MLMSGCGQNRPPGVDVLDARVDVRRAYLREGSGEALVVADERAI